MTLSKNLYLWPVQTPSSKTSTNSLSPPSQPLRKPQAPNTKKTTDISKSLIIVMIAILDDCSSQVYPISRQSCEHIRHFFWHLHAVDMRLLLLALTKMFLERHMMHLKALSLNLQQPYPPKNQILEMSYKRVYCSIWQRFKLIICSRFFHKTYSHFQIDMD